LEGIFSQEKNNLLVNYKKEKMKYYLQLALVLLIVSDGFAQVSDLDGPTPAPVISDDLIVKGSGCIGLDCLDFENFGFSTVILKENNLRLRFNDTSTGSFPSNDWELKANDNASGGKSYFSIVDVDADRTPFLIEAGAPNNGLYLDDGGRLGLGTANPSTELHMIDGDTPAMRLDQNGNSGFAPQIWDVAGNETNFFIRDVTNGSSLPFRIRPGAPSSSIFIDIDGKTGIGTNSPEAQLDVNGDLNVRGSGTSSVKVGSDDGHSHIDFFAPGENSVEYDLRIMSRGGVSEILHNGNESLNLKSTTGAIALQTDGKERILVPGTGAVSIASPVVANGGIDVVMDRRLVEEIGPLSLGLEAVLKMDPVLYRYSGAENTWQGRQFVGLVAQDVQQYAPAFVSGKADLTDNGSVDYLNVHDSELKFILINAIKEQQEIIQQQRGLIVTQNEKIETMEANIGSLDASYKEVIEKLNQLLPSDATTLNLLPQENIK